MGEEKPFEETKWWIDRRPVKEREKSAEPVKGIIEKWAFELLKNYNQDEAAKNLVDINQKIFKGLTIATFGGNPVTMAAAKAVVDAIAADRLMDNAATVGGHLRSRLDAFAEKHAVVGEVRGMGLMQGIELVKDKPSREPAPGVAAAVMEAAKDRGLIIGKGGLYGNVLRISPALNVSQADADQAADVLDQALAEGAKA